MQLDALRSMTRATRVIIALALPPIMIAAYMAARYEFGFRSHDFFDWSALLLPTFGGAALLSLAPWPLGARIALVVSYIVLMLGLVFLVGLVVACSFGDCL
jgi:hypothetical protein